MGTKGLAGAIKPTRPGGLTHAIERDAGAMELTDALSAKPKSSDTSHGACNLTPEEIQFFANAKASGRLEKLMQVAKTFDTGVTLEEVKQSTADQRDVVESVSKQASILQSHLERCRSLVDSSVNTQALRADAQQKKLSAARAAKARLEQTAASDELKLQQSNPQGLTYIEKHEAEPAHLGGRVLGTCIKGTDLPMSIVNDEFFDNLLEKLQALGCEIKMLNENESLVKTASYYSSLEVMLSVVACKRLLNHALVEAMEKYSSISSAVASHPRALEDEIRATIDEINSLWDEVVPVAHMAIEKTMLEPILKLVNAKERSQKHQNAIISSYIGNCLSFMNERLELLASRLSIAVYHQLALLVAYEHHRDFRTKEVAIPNYKHNTGHVRDSVYGGDEPSEPATALTHIRQVMEAYGGFPTKVFDPLTPTENKITMLVDFLAKRTAKDNERFNNLNHLFESATKASLNGSTNINTDVLECLLADSLRGTSHSGAVLRDAQTEESLEAIENENRDIRSLLHSLQLPQVQHKQDTIPAYRRLLHSLAVNQAGVAPPGIPKHVNAEDDHKEYAGPKMALKGLEVIQRWGGLVDASKE